MIQKQNKTPPLTIMKKLLILPLALLAMTACKKEGASSSENSFQIVGMESDSTKYGISERVQRDSLLWIQNYSEQGINGNTDTTWVSLVGAQRLGSLEQGHKIALLFAEGSKNKARIVIDMTELAGRWVEPDAVDEGMMHGIELQDGGAASSINSRADYYTQWRIYNGKLLMTNSIDGRTSEEMPKDTFQITYLSQDSLRLTSTMNKYYFRRSSSDQNDISQEYESYSSPDANAFDPEERDPDGLVSPEIPEYDKPF